MIETATDKVSIAILIQVDGMIEIPACKSRDETLALLGDIFDTKMKPALVRAMLAIEIDEVTCTLLTDTGDLEISGEEDLPG